MATYERDGALTPIARRLSSGQWGRIELSIWTFRTKLDTRFNGSLIAAADYYSPQTTYENGHLPHETPPAQDPRKNHPRQMVRGLISADEVHNAKAVGYTTDLNRS